MRWLARCTRSVLVVGVPVTISRVIQAVLCIAEKAKSHSSTIPEAVNTITHKAPKSMLQYTVPPIVEVPGITRTEHIGIGSCVRIE